MPPVFILWPLTHGGQGIEHLHVWDAQHVWAWWWYFASRRTTHFYIDSSIQSVHLCVKFSFQIDCKNVHRLQKRYFRFRLRGVASSSPFDYMTSNMLLFCSWACCYCLMIFCQKYFLPFDWIEKLGFSRFIYARDLSHDSKTYTKKSKIAPPETRNKPRNMPNWNPHWCHSVRVMMLEMKKLWKM